MLYLGVLETQGFSENPLSRYYFRDTDQQRTFVEGKCGPRRRNHWQMILDGNKI